MNEKELQAKVKKQEKKIEQLKNQIKPLNSEVSCINAMLVSNTYEWKKAKEALSIFLFGDCTFEDAVINVVKRNLKLDRDIF